MKNLLLISILAAFIFVLASCKAHEKCPAYGHSGNSDSEKKI